MALETRKVSGAFEKPVPCQSQVTLLKGENGKMKYYENLYVNNSLHLVQKYARSSENRTVFREHSLRKTVSFKEQIMSKDKYPSIFARQMEAIVFIILQIFFATHTVLKIGEYSRIFPCFSWGIFGHVTCLDQSRESENI